MSGVPLPELLFQTMFLSVFLSMISASKVPVRRSSQSPKLREARFEDHSQVAKLTAKFQLQTESYLGWTHLWINNPAYREQKDKFPIGWVLENADGTICGYFGNIPLNYELDGRRLLAASGRSWVVDTAYRAYAPLLLAKYFQQSNVDLFLVTSVNSQAAPAYAIFQSVPVPVGGWDRMLFWITHPQGFAHSLLRKRGWAMAKVLSYPLSAGVLLHEGMRGGRFPESANDVKVISCTNFDDRFDTFWAALRRKKSALLLSVRSLEVLQWHFKSALQQNAAWIYVVEGDCGLAAYSIFIRQDSPDVGLKRIRLADFQCLEPERAPGLLAAMLQSAMVRCRQESIHMLELIGLTPQLEKEAERAAPHRRRLANWMFFYKTNDRFLMQTLQSASVWEPWLFDGDSSL